MSDVIERLNCWAGEIDNDGTPSQAGPSANDLREVAAEIASLRAQLDGMKRAAEVRDRTVSALNETCVNQGFEIADLKAKLDGARRKAIEDAARTAENYEVQHELNGQIARAIRRNIAKDIRALLSESKT